MKEFLKTLVERQGEEMGEAILALMHIVDLENPTIETPEKIGIEKLIATLHYLVLERRITHAPKTLLQKAPKITTAAKFREIAEELNKAS